MGLVKTAITLAIGAFGGWKAHQYLSAPPELPPGEYIPAEPETKATAETTVTSSEAKQRWYFGRESPSGKQAPSRGPASPASMFSDVEEKQKAMGRAVDSAMCSMCGTSGMGCTTCGNAVGPVIKPGSIPFAVGRRMGIPVLVRRVPTKIGYADQRRYFVR